MVSSLWAGLRRRHRERLTQKVLEGLDDRTLHDIGIERSEITSIARSRTADRRVKYVHML
jgi:uncharacterized protein YjiS (DUF1127 family)